MNKNYYLSTGEIDYQRLSILSKLYNPGAISFLKNSGVRANMTVLEIGCGTGHMACDIARELVPQGKVIAIDNSPEQIVLAKKTAKELGVHNIEFHTCDVFELAKLDIEYNATYGRWVIEFSQQPEKALEILYRYLKQGGILCYEAISIDEKAFFSYPEIDFLVDWFAIGSKLFSINGYNPIFSHAAPSHFKKIGCKNLKAKTNQAILLTPEEKSVYRLALYTVKNTLLKNNMMTEEQIEKMCEKFLAYEKSDGVSGFYNNILISGEKV